MTISAKIVAKFIVQHSAPPISNLKLQKVLYYVQGWHLGLYDKPLFTEEVQAWVHGPVVPDVFFLYRHFRWTPIEIAGERVQMDSAAEKHTLAVMRAYGKLTAQQLEVVSHSEPPWIKARGSLPPDAPSNAVITHASMREYFSTITHGQAKT